MSLDGCFGVVYHVQNEPEVKHAMELEPKERLPFEIIIDAIKNLFPESAGSIESLREKITNLNDEEIKNKFNNPALVEKIKTLQEIYKILKEKSVDTDKASSNILKNLIEIGDIKKATDFALNSNSLSHLCWDVVQFFLKQILNSDDLPLALNIASRYLQQSSNDDPEIHSVIFNYLIEKGRGQEALNLINELNLSKHADLYKIEIYKRMIQLNPHQFKGILAQIGSNLQLLRELYPYVCEALAKSEMFTQAIEIAKLTNFVIHKGQTSKREEALRKMYNAIGQNINEHTYPHFKEIAKLTLCEDDEDFDIDLGNAEDEIYQKFSVFFIRNNQFELACEALICIVSEDMQNRVIGEICITHTPDSHEEFMKRLFNLGRSSQIIMLPRICKFFAYQKIDAAISIAQRISDPHLLSMSIYKMRGYLPHINDLTVQNYNTLITLLNSLPWELKRDHIGYICELHLAFNQVAMAWAFAEGLTDKDEQKKAYRLIIRGLTFKDPLQAAEKTALLQDEALQKELLEHIFFELIDSGKIDRITINAVTFVDRYLISDRERCLCRIIEKV